MPLKKKPAAFNFILVFIRDLYSIKIEVSVMFAIFCEMENLELGINRSFSV